MSYDLLDNPVWHSLCTKHRSVARGTDCAKRFEAEVAPFAGVPHAAVNENEAALAEIIVPGETVFFMGCTPALAQGLWEIEEPGPALQMVCETKTNLPPLSVAITSISAEQAPDMIGLTDIAFPGFFRSRTHILGQYIGIYLDGKLVAMAGERLFVEGYREISGVCTHPDYRGRGYASYLVGQLVNKNLDKKLASFLHVGHGGERARVVYERLGFAVRRELPLVFGTRREK